MTNILIIEDDKNMAEMERDFLEGSGYIPHVAKNGEEALKIMNNVNVDAIILDVNLPEEDGFSLCRKLRDLTDSPIIFATGRDDDADIVRGLGLGADDYLVKPFRGTVLIAHLKAQLATHKRLINKNNYKPCIEDGLTIGELTIRPKARQILLDNKEVIITGKEFDLLLFLVEHPNEVFSKEQLFEQIWGLDPIGDPATVTVHINRLRDKLKSVSGRPYEKIETVWGAGYRFHID